ncbi:MAG: imidazole glycerol phosphate synthase subunit HisH [Burkholderiales bacterium]|nr:imidazole glycerol phosphate synthase subunit HisH [Burkholderiales bacterium]
MKIGVINYGTGNIYSISSALNEIGADHIVINSSTDLFKVDAIILPGVGSFSDTKKKLDENYWSEEIIEFVTNKNKALLGICLGMQLLADSSTEGFSNTVTPGLGLIPGRVDHLRSFGCNLRTPHVGWNSINLTQINSPMFEKICDGTDFYFVHSFAFSPINTNHLLATAEYGINFAAAVAKERIWGTQFHPEKSSKAGFLILKNFIDFVSC